MNFPAVESLQALTVPKLNELCKAYGIDIKVLGLFPTAPSYPPARVLHQRGTPRSGVQHATVKPAHL